MTANKLGASFDKQYREQAVGWPFPPVPRPGAQARTAARFMVFGPAWLTLGVIKASL